jgi:hypothetical protein
MKIINEYPPNYDKITAKFDLTGEKPVFTYGNILYNPHHCNIEQHCMVHEETHEKQQMFVGVDYWWEQYLINPQFRLTQEIEAYRAQYRSVIGNLNRSGKYFFVDALANALSSKMYGSIITKEDAKKEIRQVS